MIEDFKCCKCDKQITADNLGELDRNVNLAMCSDCLEKAKQEALEVDNRMDKERKYWNSWDNSKSK